LKIAIDQGVNYIDCSGAWQAVLSLFPEQSSYILLI